jgi:hypothetical protein
MKVILIKRKNHYDLFEETRLISTTECEDGTVNKLSKQNCDEIFGVVDVEKLAEEWVFETNEHKWSNNDDTAGDNFGSYREGFNKAMELNKDKQFTLEDFKLFARMYYREIRMNKSNLLWDSLADKCLEEHLTLIQQPTEIEVEIEMEKVVDETKVVGAVKGVKGSGDKITTYKSVPKLDADGCLILKKV